MGKAIHFEGRDIEFQGVFYGDYSCPFCHASVELIRCQDTISPDDVSFRGRCVKCGADGPPEDDSVKALSHFNNDKESLFGGYGVGIVLPKRLVKKGGPIEVHVPLPPYDYRNMGSRVSESVLISDAPKIATAVYRVVDYRHEDATVYEFVGVKQS